ncbi:MAG: type II toxin-antitoxin system RelE/ParE family toxin [Bacteroidota bacterium]
MILIESYVNSSGINHFEKWFRKLDARSAAKVNTYITRIGLGSFSNVKAVGEGVSELKINWGPGYRVYFGKAGEKLILLLCGGDKSTQPRDILKAKELWKEYKRDRKN